MRAYSILPLLASVTEVVSGIPIHDTAITPVKRATGIFNYIDGSGTRETLSSPESGTCINLPGTTEREPGFAPENLSTSTATVFLDFDCEGDVFYVIGAGKKLGNRLKLRSVVFS